MVYRALGILVNKNGLTIAFAEFHENAGTWSFEIKESASYPTETSPGFITRFIEEADLQYKAALITVHSASDAPIFSGAAMAAETGLPVITSLDALDKELGGNGEFLTMAAQKLGLVKAEMDEKVKTACIAFMGILRWREEYNFLSSITGARRSSIGGALWLGQEA